MSNIINIFIILFFYKRHIKILKPSFEFNVDNFETITIDEKDNNKIFINGVVFNIKNKLSFKVYYNKNNKLKYDFFIPLSETLNSGKILYHYCD